MVIVLFGRVVILLLPIVFRWPVWLCRGRLKNLLTVYFDYSQVLRVIIMRLGIFLFFRNHLMQCFGCRFEWYVVECPTHLLAWR